jgi:hypothetical protein
MSIVTRLAVAASTTIAGFFALDNHGGDLPSGSRFAVPA